ncbi:ribonuclease P protein component [Aureibaculum sp. 2210JD6-5]|uniref:ribonuclease P protein component n=1 Tax=Aureibaculum sp. 2210JD6-5 TaxID=3103957 RepID=UPI002AACCDE0|nr:ribonuclease P protein component [Aureibaculum sp. 2210JD6-5]MDY7396195.1 ribonuclease P protein component [Aureibaculum sp. 2210JD6-5]
MRFTLKKEEKLKSKRLIGELFEKGKSLSKFPLRLVYLQVEHLSSYPIQVAFSAPKRRFKKAVDRNRIKRLMREAYRKNKHILYDSIKEKHIIMFTYTDENELKYVEIEEKMVLLLRKFEEKIKSQKNEKG